MMADGTLTYVWNARDEISQVKSGSTVVGSFTYDGLGRRSQKAISSTSTRFLYDGLNIAQEQDGTGAVSANLLTGLGLDEVFQRTSGGTNRDFLTDALGSVVALANASAVVRTQYSYEPYGRMVATGDVDTNAQQFTGRENDGSTTGLYYLRARYYSPVTQRFLGEDPIGPAGSGVNLYAYAADRPTALIDPIGLEGEGRECGPLGVDLHVSLLFFDVGLGWSPGCGFDFYEGFGFGLGFSGGVTINPEDTCASVDVSGAYGPRGGSVSAGWNSEGEVEWSGGIDVSPGERAGFELGGYFNVHPFC
jgi:RHS repeat-associated protein